MKKNKGRKGLAFILVILLAMGAGAYYVYLPRAYAADEGKEPILEDGQEYAYAKITSILGNEMAYSIVDAQTADSGNIQENGARKGGAPDEGSGGERQDASGSVMMNYTETCRTGQMQIPVGTEVETKLGTVTTFSRLSNGDVIKMLLQEDDDGNKALVKIWIVG